MASEETRAWVDVRRRERVEAAASEARRQGLVEARGVLLACADFVGPSAAWGREARRGFDLASSEARNRFPTAKSGHEKQWLEEWQRANRTLCRRWVLRGLLPAARALRERGIDAEHIARLNPPEPPWRDALEILGGLLVGGTTRSVVRRAARDLAVLRETLREDRFTVSDAFRWLASTLPMPSRSERNLRATEVRALRSLQWVESTAPHLEDRRAQYSHIREHGGGPAYEGEQIPAFETWSRYVRTGTASSSAGAPPPSDGPQPGRSVVRRTDI